MRKRLAIVAGMFYPGEKNTLLKEIEKCFKSPLGPGNLPAYKKESIEKAKIIGAVVPHAGYQYSGPVAAHVYYELATKSTTPDVIVILGPNHQGLGAPIAVSTADYWTTPLGEVEVDHTFVEKLVEISEIIERDDLAHSYEHSIEVQIPFLQYIFPNSKLRIVPITMMLQEPKSSKIVGEAIKQAADELKLSDVVVLASSDFTHYESQNVAYRKDKKAIDSILELDARKFYDIIIENDISVCGPGPIMTLISYAKQFSNVKAKLLKYATSGDVTGRLDAVVGYAAITFEILQ